MAIINLRDSTVTLSSQDEVTILNQEIVDLSNIVEQLDLTQLADVTIASVEDGELLVYNSGTGEWENSSALKIRHDEEIELNTALVKLNGNLISEYNEFIVLGAYDDLVRSIRMESNPVRNQRPRTCLRAETRFVDGNGDLLPAADGFGTDINFSINDTEMANLSTVLATSAFNPDGTVDVDNSASKFVVLTRGTGHTGPSPLYAMEIDPWNNRFRLQAADSNGISIDTDDKLDFTVDGDTPVSISNDNLTISASEVDFTGLPTTNPGVAGRLWNNAGILTISNG